MLNLPSRRIGFTRHAERQSSTRWSSALVRTAFQFFVLYSLDDVVPASLERPCHVLLKQLARGLRSSIRASLPTAAPLFIFAPCLAQKKRIVITRYTVLVLYLVGSTLGALLL